MDLIVEKNAQKNSRVRNIFQPIKLTLNCVTVGLYITASKTYVFNHVQILTCLRVRNVKKNYVIQIPKIINFFRVFLK